MRASRTAALAGTGLALLLAGCGEAAAPQGQDAPPCTDLPSADARAVLPPDVPAPAGQVLFRTASQGKTVVVFGRLPGTDVVAVRDQVVTDLRAARYTIESTDQEAVEAEAFFSGPHTGTLRVRRLCADQLELRWKLED